jgi:predicted O-methyltransferase YrrM
VNRSGQLKSSPRKRGPSFPSAKSWVLALLLAASAASAQAQTQAQTVAQQPDVIFVPTPQEVVDAMLNLANVHQGDVLYDLGSGDGRIPVTAAKQYGIRAYGIDIDPQRIQEANANAAKAGVTHLVRFRREDLFKANFKEATVVTLYLLPDLNVKLRPRLLAELKPGTRIVSHQFDMGTWKPDKKVELSAGRTIYLWTIPPRKQQ